MSRSLGIPVKLLHEGSGQVVTVELKSGELYRGSMIECEDNWNCQLDNITFTAKKSEVDIPFKSMFAFSLAFASLFSSSPLHQIGKSSSLGVGRGRAVAMRAKLLAEAQQPVEVLNHLFEGNFVLLSALRSLLSGAAFIIEAT
ncbi:small nuclear ribonucleoprotein SmD3a [Gossypium hirsutum]|uniref:Small nuclear ribonucleoprotein Sm D3 n=1 Tax=Gossypium hirsutum TaxID=3635 RepID=A0A1U8J7Y5_GOSHI|nr:small nuclear ribonucleoprotein SmD3a-like [Gossypium hirsutum]